MDTLVFFYYFVCYSIGVIGLIVAILAAVMRKTVQDRRFAFFIGGMTLMVLSFTVGSYLLSTQRLNGSVATTVGLVNVVADSFLVFTLPFFVHSVVPVARAAVLNKVWGGIALVAAVAGIAAMLANGFLVVFTFLFASMGASVAYATLTGVVHLIARKGIVENSVPREDRARWKAMLVALPLTSAGYLPFFVIFDLFPQRLPSLTGALAPTIKVFPSFYAIINGLYVATTIPSLIRKPGRDRLVPVDAEGLDLSPREREVAALLAEGRTYKEIADLLFVSLATVKTHVERIYKKTGASNKTQLSFMARSKRPD